MRGITWRRRPGARSGKNREDATTFSPHAGGERSEQELYKILRVDSDDVCDHPTAMEQLTAGTLDGIVVERAIDRESIRECAERLERFDSRREPLHFGAMLGYPLNRAPAGTDAYLDAAAEFTDPLDDIFGLDIGDHITRIFQQMTSCYRVGVPLEEGRPYAPGTFRIMAPGLGGLKAHTGNEFVENNKDRGMSWLVQVAKMLDSMSYFLLVQEPDGGGDLLLSELLWEHTPDHLKGFERNARDDSFFESGQYQSVPLRAGDAIVFSAGHIWHKVSDIDGTTERITFGGFMAPSIEGDQLWFWG